MTLRTRLTERLEIEHPLLLAPMGFVSGGALAGAVTDAGGLGIIGAGYGDGEWIERQFAAAGNRRVGCGFITWSLARQPELLERVLAHRPAAMMLSFGDPRPFAPAIKAAAVPLLCQVQTLAHLEDALAAGADIIVVQGSEAGGHGARRATLPFVPEAVDRLRKDAPEVLVVAAGGIVDGRGLAASLMLGADGVLLGTRFYASTEALAHPRAKARVVAASGDDTLRTRVFDIARGIPWPAEFTGRALGNDFAARWHGAEAELEAAQAREMPRYQAAATIGDFATAVIFAGEGTGLVEDVADAGDIVRRVIAEAEAALRAGAASIR